MLEIILVDDAREDLLLAERVLRSECKLVNPISFCKSGEDAIALIDKQNKDGTPFVMFLDLVMAPVSGLQVLLHWRNARLSSRSVVVMVSGLTDMKSIHEGYQQGASTFVLKPLNKDDVLQVLNSLSSKIAIQDVPEGYALFWREEALTEPDTTHLTRRVVTLSA